VYDVSDTVAVVIDADAGRTWDAVMTADPRTNLPLRVRAHGASLTFLAAQAQQHDLDNVRRVVDKRS
jgi:hypothetical protein